MEPSDDYPDWFEQEQIHFAAMDGDVKRARQLLADGVPIDRFDETAHTALHYAAENEKFELVEFLLNAGANVNAQDESRAGDTPLGTIAATCSLRMAKRLIAAGADPRRPGGMQLSALDRARKRKRGEGPAVYAFLCEIAQRGR